MSLKIRPYEDRGDRVEKGRDPGLTLNQHLLEMLALDRQVLETVVQQLSYTEIMKYPAVRAVLERVHVTMVGQTSDLARRAGNLGGDHEGVIKEKIARIAGQIAGVSSRARSSRVSRALREQYGSLNMAAVGYEMLHSTALALNDRETAEIALRHLTEIAPIIVQLNQVVPETVARELQQEGKQVDPNTAKEAIENINSAWSKAAEQQISLDERLVFESD